MADGVSITSSVTNGSIITSSVVEGTSVTGTIAVGGNAYQGPIIQRGSGVFSQGASANKSATVTFPTAFSAAPIVLVTYGGDNANVSVSYGSGGNNVKGPVTAKAHTITTTTFVAQVHTADGTSWGATDNVFYQWIAISPT